MSGPSETDGPEATERAGAELAGQLRGGDVVLVSGDLGSGKTTFVRGALRALGVTEAITSPTFVVGILYDGTAGPLAHRTDHEALPAARDFVDKVTEQRISLKGSVRSIEANADHGALAVIVK